MSRPDVASGQGGHPGANPFLPEWEYVPDGEPHVFGDRVYLYGSHDRFGAPIFCVGDYVCWSAPVDDLAAWREEGVIYRRGQDPANRLGLRLLFAPDVARGTDGRYYLFYAFDFMGTIGVAVCDSPAGRYEYLGCVHYPDGTPYGRRAGDGFAFDPAVLARALDLPEQEEILMLLDLGYAAPGFKPLPNHSSRKPLSDTVTYL